MYGVLVIDKPAGMTSHDVVNAVRRLAGMRRVGHTGTLDPIATGVLVLLLGPATRLAQFASGATKRYRALIRLGVSTTTYDAAGEPLERHAVDVDLDRLETALAAFRGEIEQVPPMYSAIKVKGRKLYELARQGKTVPRPPRAVTFYAIDILNWQSPDLTLDVTCSAGTYIRSLAHDLGQELGCGAHLAALRRTASGPFDLSTSHTLDALQTLRDQNRLSEALLPPYAALGSMPCVTITEDEEQALRHGRRLTLEQQRWSQQDQAHDVGDVVQARNARDHLVAVMITLEDDHYQPKVVLPPEGDSV
jgi:tRNA pseudouridine55 synthase